MTPTLDRPAVLGVVTLLLVVGGIGLAVAPAGALTTTDSTDATNYDLWWGDGDEDPTFDSASAEVTGETADGEVSEVTFQYDAPNGELVLLQVGDETEIVFATGVERTSTVDLGGFFWSDTEPYPVNVTAEVIGGERCSATVNQGDGVVTLCDGDDGEAAYDLSIDSNSPVTEGEGATVDATVENTGTAEGTEDVTVEVADQSTTQSVTLAPGESTTVSLDWQTEENDAGNYTANASVAGETASTEVRVQPEVTPATFTIADVATNSPVTEGDDVVVDATVENTGDQQGTQTVSLDVGALGSNSTQLTLGAGANDTVSLSVDTSDGDAGEYTAEVSTDDDTATAPVTVDAPEPQPFLGYVAGDEGYLDTNATNANVSATEFAECADFAPTQDAIDAEPDYLPEPECIVMEGTYYPSNESWDGDVLFPESVSERNNTLLGEIYSSAEITTVDGARGTLDRDTGRMTLETEVNISVGVFAPPNGHGTPWEDRGDSVVGQSCHIPNVQINATTGQHEDLSGEALDNGTATLVDEFAIGSATDCGGLAGAINDAQGIPTDPGESEVVFDFVFDFQPDQSDGTVEGTVTDVDTGTPIAGATVSAGGASTTTDADGNYSLSVEPGIHTVSVQTDIGQSDSQQAFVTSGDATTADFRLEPVLQSIELDLEGFPEDPELAIGEQPVIVVNATYSNGVVENVATPDLVTSSNESLVGIGSFLGVPLAQTNTTTRATGDVTLTAQYQGLTDTENVTVVPAEIDTREITVRENVSVGDAQEGVVQQVWTDGTTVDVTENYTVSSSAPSVATVEKTAEDTVIVRGESTGSATITASEIGGPLSVTHDVTILDPEIEVAGNGTTGSPGFTTTVGFDAQALGAQAVPIAEYTVGLTFDRDNVTLVDVHGASHQTDGDVVLVSGAPGNQTPQDLFTVELQLTENASVGSEVPIEVVEHRSEVVEQTGGFFSSPVYALPTWTDGSIAVEAPTLGTVEGTVTDADTGDPIENATVSTEQSSTTTDASGQYSLELQPDQYTLAVDHDDYAESSVSASVTGGATTTADVALTPLDFQAYVAGEEGYLHTNTSAANVSAIEFTESEDFEPTQDAIDAEPDYLPEPETITVEGVIDEQNGTWEGDAYFPVSVSERNNSILGPIYSEAQITPVDGVEGTIDRETGEMTLETEVNISIAIYDLENGHGVEWENRPDPITPETCHIPSVQLEATTESSGDMTGERLDNGTATLVGNEFPIDGAQGCGGLFTGPINDAQGIPTAEGDAEVLFDLVFEFADPAEPEPADADFQVTDVSANSPTEGDDLVVDATIENVGDQQGTQTVALDVGALGSNSTSLTLAAGSNDTVSLAVGTGQGDNGTYTAEVSTANDSASTQVTVGTTVTDGAIEGTVTDNETGNAIDGATVSVAGEQTTTDANGNYSLTVAAGSYTVEADASGYESASRSVSVTAGSTATADVALESQPSQANFTIVGLAIDSDVTEGEPFTVTPTVENTGGQQGTQTVELNVSGLGTDAQSVTLNAGESTGVSLSIPTQEGDAGSYSGEITTDNDTHPTGVTVEDLAPANFSITDVSTSSPVSEGDSLTVDATIENTGDQQGTQTVDLDVGALGSNSSSLTLGAGSSDTVSLSVSTAQGDAGSYTAQVGTDDDSGSAPVTVEAPGPQQFEGYVAGDQGYLHTNASNQNVSATEFTQCEDTDASDSNVDAAPTQDALDASPDYLPAPECITFQGTYYPSNDTWQGDVDFPLSVSETTSDISTIGPVYAAANISTSDGASGTLDPESGEMTLETEVDIGVSIYNVDSHGTSWADRGDPITPDACRIPNVQINATTGSSDDMSGESLENGTATVVDNQFSIDSSVDCSITSGSIDDARGLPASSGDAEVVFDVVFEYTGS